MGFESPEQSKVSRAITEILKKTKYNHLNWISLSQREETDRVLIPKFGIKDDITLDGKTYIVEYKRKILRIYNTKVKLFDETGSFYWKDLINLDLVDDDGDLEWTFPHHSSFVDLLEAIKYQVAKVEDFLDDLINM